MGRDPQMEEKGTGKLNSGSVTDAGGFGSDRTAVVSAVLVALILIISVAAPLFTPYGSNQIDLDSILASPSAEHILGTDELGRDLFSRLLYGGRYTLLVALLAVIISGAIGTMMGSLAGYFRGPADRVISSCTDLFLSIPVFLVIMVLASAGRGRLWMIPLVIGGTSWMETSRVVRSRFIQLKEEEFVSAARLLGVADVKIIMKHILPQALVPATVSAVAGFSGAMLIESSLSFLGFGVQPPIPSWGNMLHNAQALLRNSPMSAFAPGFMIFIAALSFNFIASGLKRSLAVRDDSL